MQGGHTCRAVTTVEPRLSVVAGYRGVGGAGLVGQVTLVDVSHTGWVAASGLPAILTHALELGLEVYRENISHLSHYGKPSTICKRGLDSAKFSVPTVHLSSAVLLSAYPTLSPSKLSYSLSLLLCLPLSGLFFFPLSCLSPLFKSQLSYSLSE